MQVLNTTYNTRLDVLSSESDVSIERGALHYYNGSLKMHTDTEIVNISGSSDQIRFISSKSDFPESVSGVITLLADVTYFLTDFIDLEGDRLVGASNTTIIGGSSENCGLTSTGLGVGVPLLTSSWTMPIRHITFKDVDTAISFDGTVNTVALDWTGVNFNNVPNIGTINTCDNFIYTKGAFLSAQNLILTGTIGTVAFNQSLFNAYDNSAPIFVLDSGLTITRRFRIIYSSIIVLSGETAISIDGSATIPNEGVILDTCNFSGGGTYLSGITFQDNEALFVNNVGITNSREVSQYYMNGNATATTVAATNTEYKAAGTTTSGSLTSKFTNTDNRATYTGSIERIFTVTATLSITSGNNNQIGMYIAKNGTIIPESETYMTTNGSGRAEAAAVQAIVTLTTNDYIEIFVENATAVQDITVTDLNVLIQ